MSRVRVSRKLEFGKLATPLPDRNRLVYRWFQMKESFSSSLVKMLLDLWKPSGVVLDPFCGAGTTPLACKEAGVDCVGIEPHPLLFFISKVKTADYDVAKIQKTKEDILKKPFEPIEEKIPTFINRVFPRNVVKDLLAFRKNIREIDDTKIRDFLKTVLLRTAMRCSWVRKDGAAIKIQRRKVRPLVKVFDYIANEMCEDVLAFPEASNFLQILPGDSREMPLRDESVGAVITSPPYLFKNEYVSSFAVEEWILGLPPPNSEEMISKGEDDDEKYFESMSESLQELYRVCEHGSKLCFAISDGCSKKGAVEVCFRLSEMARDVGFRPKKIVVINERWCTSPSRRKLGKIKESLLFWDKPA